ncbi:hypothetical protein B0T14DRAFT_566015 [Immersiella caudata]|uniref:Uncharacterized protein n=1 Tax=Immersiella caudata TaxID=314043 RepID=A0AA39WPC5_9PEZI|nr:hypothetical protein B0T14DRAFT_566015 [Immersiella caudata]
MDSPQPQSDRNMTGRCPSEILLMIGACLQNLDDRPEAYTSMLAKLARTCQLLHSPFEDELYKCGVQHQGSSVMVWAASEGVIPTMEKAISRSAFVDTKGQHRQTRLKLLSKKLPKTYPTAPWVSVDHGRLRDLSRIDGTALHYTAANGQDAAVAWLLDQGSSLERLRCHAPL